MEKKRQEWKRYSENLLYKKMTESVTPYSKEDRRREELELKDYKSQLGVGHHMIVVFACVFFAGYHFFKYSLNNESMVFKKTWCRGK